MNFDAVDAKASAGPPLALKRRWSLRVDPLGAGDGVLLPLHGLSLDADCLLEGDVTLEEVDSIEHPPPPPPPGGVLMNPQPD